MTKNLASTSLSEALRPRSEGQPVNAHIVRFVAEPQPDFAAMQRTIEGKSTPRRDEGAVRDRASREVPKVR